MPTLKHLIRLEKDVIRVNHQFLRRILELVQFAVELDRGGLARESTRLVGVWMVDIVKEAVIYLVSFRVARLCRVAKYARLLR